MSWELYGYERETNPRLSQVDDLVIFRDVLTQSNTHAQERAAHPLLRLDRGARPALPAAKGFLPSSTKRAFRNVVHL